MKKIISVIMAFFICLMFISPAFTANNHIIWGTWATISSPAIFSAAGPDARGIDPGTFGAEYGRMAKLTNGDWISVCTIYDNNGYLNDPNGGTRLEIAKSSDNCRNWQSIFIIQEPGRDLDNGQIVQLENGDLLIACRSVRWQESYKIDVYKSSDLGNTWSYLSTIDENHGAPGELGNPDKGVYEPHIGLLHNGEIAVFYSSEKHVTDTIPYAQIVSEKVSKDNGLTWSEEIWVAWDPEHPYAKPGMPVFTQMSNGQFIVVFEDGYHDGYNVHYKISHDGKTWDAGLGTAIPDQLGAPYITRLSNGRLLIISNLLNVSYSDDNGVSWITNQPAPWMGSFPDYCWASCYQTGENEIAVMGSAPRPEGGHAVRIRFGTLNLSQMFMPYFTDFNYGNAFEFTTYNGTWNVENNEYSINGDICGKAITGDKSWENYVFEADVKPIDSIINSGVVFRVQSAGPGIDEMHGYFAGLNSSGVILGKQQNNWTVLDFTPMTVKVGEWHHMKVIANGTNIQVYVNDMNNPRISISDSTFLNGKIGVRAVDCHTHFDNISVSPVYVYEDNFVQPVQGRWTEYGGSWSQKNGEYIIGSVGSGKSLINGLVQDDYTIEADVKPMDAVINSGIVFRVQKPNVGADDMQGYFVGLNAEGVVLGSMNYNWVMLAHESLPIATNTWHHLKIVVKGSRIQVFVNDMTIPQIDINNTLFTTGQIGVRAYWCATAFRNIRIY
jgi:hypothetical protein